MPERLLKTSQVAKLLSMHPHTVRAYAEAGAFEGAYKFRGPRAAKNGRGEWRIPETATFSCAVAYLLHDRSVAYRHLRAPVR